MVDIRDVTRRVLSDPVPGDKEQFSLVVSTRAQVVASTTYTPRRLYILETTFTAKDVFTWTLDT